MKYKNKRIEYLILREKRRSEKMFCHWKQFEFNKKKKKNLISIIFFKIICSCLCIFSLISIFNTWISSILERAIGWNTVCLYLKKIKIFIHSLVNQFSIIKIYINKRKEKEKRKLNIETNNKGKHNTSWRFCRPLNAGIYRFSQLFKTYKLPPRRHCFKYKAILNV